MKSLNILVVLLIGIAYSEGILAKTEGTNNTAETESNSTTQNSTPPATTSSNSNTPTTSTTLPPPSSTTVDPRCDIASFKCYRNDNGMCRRFKTPCDAENSKNSLGDTIEWKETSNIDCALRIGDEVKVCQSDCNLYEKGTCYPVSTPVCGYSKLHGECRLFDNLCSLKQDACRFPGTKDWRVADHSLCLDLRINGPAKKC